MTKTIENFDLVKGKFSSLDAEHLLLGLIDHKIEYHENRNYLKEERFGTKEQESVNRLNELRAMRVHTRRLIDEATRNGFQLKIHSTLHIELEK